MIDIGQLVRNAPDVGGVLFGAARQMTNIGAKDVLQAAKEGLKATQTEKPIADAATQAERLAICRACPIFLPYDQRCDRTQGGCNCYMPEKVKLARAACPKGKWSAV